MTKKMLAAGGYDFGGSILQNLGNGSASGDAVTVSQVNALISSMASNLDYKGSVRVASTSPLTVSSAVSTIDGVGLVSGDRILLKDQAAPAENGIYTYSATSSPFVRATDADANAEVTPGLWVTVEEGTVNADTAFILTTNGPIVVGTTALTFTKYTVATGGGSLTKYTVTGPASAGTSWTITHSLGNADVLVSIRDASTNDEVDVAVTHTSTSVVTVTASASMGINAYKAVVIG